MSKTDLLSIEEQATAATQGWSLSHVYDLASSQWRVMVLGMPSADVAGRLLVTRARAGDLLAQKALSFVMHSNKEKK